LVIFLIGPSGVGKTPLAKSVSDGSKIIHIDLDSSVKQSNNNVSAPVFLGKHGPRWFFEEGRKEIELLHSKDTENAVFLVDVGAGFLLADEAFEFFKSQNTILVYAPPEIVYPRNKQKACNLGRQYDEFCKTEYLKKRELHANCRYRIDVADLSESEAKAKFKTELEKAVNLFRQF